MDIIAHTVLERCTRVAKDREAIMAPHHAVAGLVLLLSLLLAAVGGTPGAPSAHAILPTTLQAAR